MQPYIAQRLLICGGALLAFAQISCSFDSSRLEESACGPRGQCADDLVCCEGYCVLPESCRDGGPDTYKYQGDAALPDIDPALDQDGDRIENSDDNCPATYNPRQTDADQDGVGDLCDCAPTDANFAAAAVQISAFSDPIPFTPIESPHGWTLTGTTYHQPLKDGFYRAAHSLPAQGDFIATITFRFQDGGDDGLTIPDTNISAAGLMIRTAGLKPGAGDGYFCGVDMASNRLIIGKTSGDELGSGTLSLFPNPMDPQSPPGIPIANVVTINLPYRLTLRAEGSLLTCQALLPDHGIAEFSVEDSDLTSGGFALFSAGASAYFERVKVCTHD